MQFLEYFRVWSDGSAVKSPGCSCKGPSFNSKHPYSDSQLLGTPIPGIVMPSSGLPGTRYTCDTSNTYTQSTYIHLKRKRKGEEKVALCVGVLVCYDVHIEVRGQVESVLSFRYMSSRDGTLDHQARQRAPLPAKPFHQPIKIFFLI